MLEMQSSSGVCLIFVGAKYSRGGCAASNTMGSRLLTRQVELSWAWTIARLHLWSSLWASLLVIGNDGLHPKSKDVVWCVVLWPWIHVLSAVEFLHAFVRLFQSWKSCCLNCFQMIQINTKNNFEVFLCSLLSFGKWTVRACGSEYDDVDEGVDLN